MPTATPELPRRSPGRPRSLASEKAILDVTLKILYEEGYSALTRDRVAALARVSKTTIYRRWATKEHLVLAVMENLPMAEIPPGADFESELANMVGQFSRIMRASPIQSVLPKIAGECAGNATLSTALIRVNNRRREPLRSVLHRAIARGEVAPETDIELAIDFIQGAIAVRALFLLEDLSPDWSRSLAHMLKSGIAAKPRSRTTKAGKR